MQYKKLLVGWLLFVTSFVWSQTKDEVVGIPTANKVPISKLIEKLITKKKKNTYLPVPINNKYSNWQGKIIRKIEIISQDPFDKFNANWGEKAGNFVHIKSKKIAVRNYLLFKKNTELDSVLIKETVRLLQRQRFLRKVQIESDWQSKDSIDLVINTLDSWSLFPTISGSSSRITTELFERNFLGLGHEMQHIYRKRLDNQQNAYGFRYFIPNIRQTFITSQFRYDEDFEKNQYKTIAVDRNFFSTLTRWAGGILYETIKLSDSLPTTVADFQKISFQRTKTELWGGHSFVISQKKQSEKLNLVSSLKWAQINYPKLNLQQTVHDGFFRANNTILASIGLSGRSFIPNNYLYFNGNAEYVQTGKMLAITHGYEYSSTNTRTYWGGKIAFGNFYKSGYWSGSAEWGSFFSGNRTEQSTLRMDLFYFSPLKSLGSWKYRHFIQPQFLFGFHRKNIKYDQISLGAPSGIDGLVNTNFGTKRYTLTWQTQAYIPKNYKGFKFSPFLNVALGALSSNDESVFTTKVYSRFGLGVLVSNDFLVFKNFFISLAYYPKISEEISNQLKTNAFRNNDMYLPDFQIAKPVVVPYQ